jgi:hypothetical protein
MRSFLPGDVVRIVYVGGRHGDLELGDVGYVVDEDAGDLRRALVRVLLMRTGRELWLLRSRLERVDA